MNDIQTDVLILGGGPAGVWAAVAAAGAGARVVLVDKARCGSSGPSAFGSTSLWNIPPGAAREEAVRHAYTHGGALGDAELMYRVLDETHRRVGQLASWGHRFPEDCAGGASLRVCLDGAGYLRRMRRAVLEAGVRVLDHHPALQLLVDSDGTVSGASGVQRNNRFRPWTVRASAVIVATGGCAFQSGSAGTEVATGDGLLLAAEAGARLSGMEFSSAYGLAPVLNSGARSMHSSYAPGLALHFATLYDETGEVIDGHRSAFGAISRGRRVFAALDDVPETIRHWLTRQGAVDRRSRVPLRAVLEGTVRGTGGLRITGNDCATDVFGLFAAGDAATREAITGAMSGFGGQSGAWAIASGVWAGAGAARFARERGRPGAVRAVPGAGLGPVAHVDPRAVIGLVQEHTLPLRRSYWRSEGSLRDSIAELDAMWPGAAFDLGGTGADRVRARQAAALLAVARWTKYSALARTETRGMHQRTDHPATTADWRARVLSGGLDEVWVDTIPLPAIPEALPRASEDAGVLPPPSVVRGQVPVGMEPAPALSPTPPIAPEAAEAEWVESGLPSA
ncbi:FAD-binding protein [Nocardia puris]|uniref:L-aspartate oxidase n=1 Tax=Nocardia puris TaxID=208602 RepID=A0A366DT00_9NOCA|nr:FAD-binding protein [Nocardia puris]RBO92619.1 succinate dehydrogenase/fumarate reductase flavoprotein subunit [Nocardia puris]